MKRFFLLALLLAFGLLTVSACSSTPSESTEPKKAPVSRLKKP